MRPDGGWRPVGYVEPEITDEELEESAREWAQWEQSPEGQAALAEIAEERKRKNADDSRLSNRVGVEQIPLHFARAVQAIYDETQEPCRADEAGRRGGMDSDEYIVGAAVATLRGMVRHPVVDGMEGRHLYIPGVG